MSDPVYRYDPSGQLVPLTPEEIAQRAVDAAPKPVDLAAYAKAARDAKEVGGITVSGVLIATDDRSKLLVAGARLRAEDNPNGTEMWAAADGKEYPLPAGAIVLISRAIGAHVSACFACYAQVKAALVADPPGITDAAGVDAAFAAVNTAYPVAAPAAATAS